jgi:hypothetical protein
MVKSLFRMFETLGFFECKFLIRRIFKYQLHAVTFKDGVFYFSIFFNKTWHIDCIRQNVGKNNNLKVSLKITQEINGYRTA